MMRLLSRHAWRGCVASLLALGGMQGAAAQGEPAADTQALFLQVGETRVLDVPGVRRVTVGQGDVLSAVTADGREVVVFGRQSGTTSLHIWSGQGSRQAYTVEVAPAGMRRVQRELDALLARVPGARSKTVGEKIVIEGEDLSDSDQARIAALAQRYPEIVDFTSRVGWDRMVMLDVQVIEIPTARLQELGLRWDAASLGGIQAGVAWEAGGSRLLERPGEAVLPAPFPATSARGYFGVDAMLPARLQALAQSGEAVILAQPQLLARSGATASFLAGGEVPYVSTDQDGRSNTVFKPYGVSLQITPQVDRSGTVRSRIDVEVSAVDAAMTTPSGPALTTRRAATEFNVRSGQTLVLGGFLSREQSRERHAVPGLGSLPILGALFRSERFQRRETELAIFVTPVVVSASHPDLAERVRLGRETLHETFPGPARPNTEVRPAEDRPGWNPYTGPGTQWSGHDARLRQESSHVEDSPALPGR